jgi:hypothetical protein
MAQAYLEAKASGDQKFQPVIGLGASQFFAGEERARDGWGLVIGERRRFGVRKEVAGR